MFYKGIYYKVVFFFWILLLFFSTTNHAQNDHINEFQYISPLPGSKLIFPETNIIIRYGEAYLNFIPDDLLKVVGSKSGIHKGRYVLAEENRTLIFYPSLPFDYGETVQVFTKKNLETITGNRIPPINFSFNITPGDRRKKLKYVIDKCFYHSSETHPEKIYEDNKGTLINRIDLLPGDFPEIYVTTDGSPSNGEVFFSPFSYPAFIPTYLVITDKYGIPVFYRKSPEILNNFKKMRGGNLSYYLGLHYYFEVIDSSYNVVDQIFGKNGYFADQHELEQLDNGHYLLMCYDPQPVSMDTVVSGGDPNATVIGLIIQELDENKDLIFQWRSWDHIPITDATYDINLTDSLIDYVHGNAIEMDQDGNILISSRHLDEITKINRQTGNIIWRWGGEYCENNQFTFINDPIGFSHQHDIRRLPNGNLTLFDNGNLHIPSVSRAVEYQLDETNKIANLVWEYKTSNQSYSPAMGSMRRLKNHNTFIGWGFKTVSVDISEVTPLKEEVFSLSFEDTIYNYRAFKNNWKTNLFRSDPDEYDFDVVHLNDSLNASINLISNSPDTIFITSSYSRSGSFKISSVLPLAVPPFQTVPLQIQFKPDTAGFFKDVLHIRKETSTERIAQLVKVYGRTDSSFTSVDDILPVNEFVLYQNYPNPFNPSTKIKFTIPSVIANPGGMKQSLVTLKIYDILGKEVTTLVNEEQPAGTYEVEFDATGLTSGLYFYQLKTGEFIETKKMLLIK